MSPRTLVRRLVHQGAVLTIEMDTLPSCPLLIAAEIALCRWSFIYYEPGHAITGRVHRLDFDELRARGERSVEFFKAGKRIAQLRTAEETGAEYVDGWHCWQRSLVDPAAREQYTASIANELADFVRDARKDRAEGSQRNTPRG